MRVDIRRQLNKILSENEGGAGNEEIRRRQIRPS